MSAPRRTYRLGLRIGRAWARRPYVAERLTVGSGILWRSLGERIAARIARTRRNDLTGIAAALGPIVGLALLAGLALALYLLVRSRPWLMWLLTGLWLWRAWRTGKKAVPAPTGMTTERAKKSSAASPDDVYAATLDWIWQMVGDRQGVHLRDLLANAQHHGMFTDLDLTRFKAVLEGRGIPVRKRVRVRGQGVTVGIHRDDLPAPPRTPSRDEGQGPADPRLHAA